jgi:hypothetical protein
MGPLHSLISAHPADAQHIFASCGAGTIQFRIRPGRVGERSFMIFNTLAWMSGEMWFLAGALLVVLAGLIFLVDRKSRKRWERGRNRPVP